MATKTVTTKRAKAKTKEASSSASKIPRGNLWVVTTTRIPSYGGVVVEGSGQVLEKQYLKNDAALLRLDYVRPIEDHEDYRACDVPGGCGRMFLGSLTSGPFRNHLRLARHGEEMDVDAQTSEPSRRVHREDVEATPDGEGKASWDLEKEGAPPPTKVEGSSETTSL